MLRCSKEAFARCPTRHLCGSREEATFMEGSDCDKFNQAVECQPNTNADWIRAMSDEELANVMIQLADLDCRIGFCKELPECEALLDTEDGIPLSKCERCLCDWLQRPAEVC